MAKLMKRNKPATAAPPDGAPEETTLVPVPEQQPDEQQGYRAHRSNPLPPHKNTAHCSKCRGEMAIYTKDPDPYDQDKLRALFHERGHSLELCGFCQRAADRAAGKYKPLLEPPEHHKIEKLSPEPIQEQEPAA